MRRKKMALAATTEATLYKRFGGYDMIAAFVDHWLGLALDDPQLTGYFKGMSNDTKGKARQLIVDFFSASLGGPTIYTGRTMKVLHDGLGISGGEYAALVGHAATTLETLGVAARERDDLLAWLDSLKGEMVERP
jgi:hemoglobin